MFVAAPVEQDYATSRTGLYLCEVIYSVNNPINKPPHTPTIEHI